MIKGKEGIALILAIVFMLAITILLTAVLLLSTQEINATQLYLDSNKAFYYAEAGVEYAQARILKADQEGNLDDNFLSELSSINTDSYLKSSFNDVNIKSVNLTVVRGDSAHKYRMSCEVKYNKATRKITKEIRILYPGLWDKAMASNGDIKLDVNNAQGGILVINGNIHSNSNITSKDPITINGNVSATGTIDNQISVSDGKSKTPNVPSLSFPDINFDEYRAKSTYIYNNETDFVNALRSGLIQTSPNEVIYVFIDGDFHLRNIEGLNVSGLCITVNGDIHVNNTTNMKIDGGSKMVTFISKNLKYNNDAKITFENCIIYTEYNTDFTNMKADVTIQNGAVYAKNGYIGLENIKKTFTITHGNWGYPQVSHLFDQYQVELWSDASI
ncbi:pilus assembly PilX N-terminal domain-containing protein [bacterium]|nr:pilus assembly PilX N-terminal domain-containing protein [bacterium]